MKVGKLSRYSKDYQGNRRMRRKQVKVDLRHERLLEKGYTEKEAAIHSLRPRGGK